jgi:hypothetical protein
MIMDTDRAQYSRNVELLEFSFSSLVRGPFTFGHDFADRFRHRF